jgi:hypothetical protein
MHDRSSAIYSSVIASRLRTYVGKEKFNRHTLEEAIACMRVLRQTGSYKVAFKNSIIEPDKLECVFSVLRKANVRFVQYLESQLERYEVSEKPNTEVIPTNSDLRKDLSSMVVSGPSTVVLDRSSSVEKELISGSVPIDSTQAIGRQIFPEDIRANERVDFKISTPGMYILLKSWCELPLKEFERFKIQNPRISERKSYGSTVDRLVTSHKLATVNLEEEVRILRTQLLAALDNGFIDIMAENNHAHLTGVLEILSRVSNKGIYIGLVNALLQNVLKNGIKRVIIDERWGR